MPDGKNAVATLYEIQSIRSETMHGVCMSFYHFASGKLIARRQFTKIRPA
jgi:hypothetical protein